MRKLLIVLLILASSAVGIYLWQKNTTKNGAQTNSVDGGSSDSNKIKLTYAVHWSQFQVDGVFEKGVLKSKGLKQYAEEYEKLHPNILINIKQLEPATYHEELKVLSDADSAPDIYQMYYQWGAPYVKAGILDKPPADVVADIKKNYISTETVTVNGDIWGFPTEINDYILVYNKAFFKEAGIANPPTTWKEFVDDAVKLTVKKNGVVTRNGFAFKKDDFELVVDPFLGLVYGNGGAFTTNDYKKSLINSPEAVQVLTSELDLFRKGATDINANFYDFSTGKVAMVFSPPWLKTQFKKNFGEKFLTDVGVAPLPVFKKASTLQYGWFMGVMAKSQHKQEAWDFLKWFASDVQEDTNTTRYGDLLTNTIGAIPARKVDLDNQEALKDFFTQEYVRELSHSTAVPSIIGFSEMRLVLMRELQAAWMGQKTPQQALDAAAKRMNEILSQ